MFTPRVPNARPAVQTGTTQYRNLLATHQPPLTDEPYVSPESKAETAAEIDAATNEGMSNAK